MAYLLNSWSEWKQMTKSGDQCICQTHTHTHPFNGPFSDTMRVSQYQKSKINQARDSEWQWHQLGCMQVCTLLQTDNHASTQPLCFLQAGYPSFRPTNSVKALKAINCQTQWILHTTPRFLQSSSSLRRSVRFLCMIRWRRDRCVKSNMYCNNSATSLGNYSCWYEITSG